MIQTACIGRKACIIDEDDTYSQVFPLEIGTTQGDCPSPTIFIFCVQILLFKVDIDPEIRGLTRPDNTVITYATGPENERFSLESNKETDKADSFADDISACLKQSVDNLSRVKRVLAHFAELSGLKCNFEKTHLLPINGMETITPEIRELGFSIVDKITGVC